jgi:hypothetical protein
VVKEEECDLDNMDKEVSCVANTTIVFSELVAISLVSQMWQ